MAKAAQKRSSASDSGPDDIWVEVMETLRSWGSAAIEILKGWGRAVVIATVAFFSIPFTLCGVTLPKLKKGEVSQAARALPVVGLAAGLIGGIVFTAAAFLGLPPLVAAILAIAALIFLSGGGNEGEFARLADVLVSGGSKTQKLAQLKEPAIGAYGICVLVLCLGLRVGIVTYIAHPAAVAGALGAAGALSFAAVAVALYALRPARRSGFAFQAGRVTADQALVAVLLAVLLMILCLLDAALIFGALVIGALAAAKFAWFSKRDLGGTTKAVLGGVQQGTEIGVLLAIAALI
ncbi:MAG: adenosylcobinamide-GDP ribazoletransferase [Alphaproteobacteria bacterium]|nr:adenosylcobinamide-GDP ribazoletransferase [Alphaproteobacteria bacterium]